MLPHFLPILLGKDTTNWGGLALATLVGIGFFVWSYYVRKYKYVRLKYGIELTGEKAVAYSWLLVAAGAFCFITVLILIALSGT